MGRTRHSRAEGFAVGEHLIISCEPVDLRVSSSSATRIFVEWPWREVDAESSSRWDGTVGFPRDPESWEWRNTPWRVEPDPLELADGDSCMIGIPPIEVQVTAIEQHDPPADFGWTPRPVWVLGVCPITDLEDDEAGFVLYLESGEPIVIEPSVS